MNGAREEADLIIGVLDMRAAVDIATSITCLDPEAFMVPGHRIIWAGFQAITARGGMIDAWALGKTMRKLGAIDIDLQLMDRYFNDSRDGLGSLDLRPRIVQVAECYKRRTVTKAMESLSSSADDLTWDEMATQLAEVVGKVSQAGNPRFQSATDYAKQFEAFLAGKPILTEGCRDNLVTFGVEGIDEAIVANPGRLIVIGGLPSAGKTALALQAAIRTAQAGKRVAMASLEMDEDEIAARIVANVCDVNSIKALKYGTDQSRGPEDRKGLNEVRKHIVGLHGCAGDSWTSIEAAVTREHRKAPLSLVIVDYIQLMGGSETKYRRNETEAQQIAQITMGAKRLAQKLKVNVLLLSQFNREVKETEEPTLQHFLGSGQIERDIDIALLLWNTQVAYERGKNRRIRCRIAKNRGGERYGLVEIDFDPAKNRFLFVPAKVQETVPLVTTQRLRMAHALGQ